jgi:hypothetical protein
VKITPGAMFIGKQAALAVYKPWNSFQQVMPLQLSTSCAYSNLPGTRLFAIFDAVIWFLHLRD